MGENEMSTDDQPAKGENLQGPPTNTYRPSNVAPPPEEEMRHDALGGRIVVQETSGTAAAEATGRLQPDNDADPEETAGSG